MVVLETGGFGTFNFPNCQKYKVLRYDVRGFGKSALPIEDEQYTDSEDLNALMNFLGIGKTHICGLSMGSIILIDFALSFPGKCVSLITCGPRVAGDGSDEYKTPNSDTVSAIIAKTTELAKNKGAKAATDYLWTGNHSIQKGVVSTVTREALLKMGYEYSW